MDEPRRAPIHPSLTRPTLLGGAGRELVLMNGTIIAALIFGVGFHWVAARDYRAPRPQAHGKAATTITSTSIPGRQKSVVRQARAGGFAGSTHSFQTAL